MLVTLHSETKQSIDYNMQMVKNLHYVLSQQKETQFVVTKANSDFGGSQINAFWDSIQDECFHVIASLGQLRYLSFMQQVDGVIGNSSSGIIEAPFLGIPTINIGKRQKGWHICKNVICSDIDVLAISESINQLAQHKVVDRYCGEGRSSDRILMYVKYF